VRYTAGTRTKSPAQGFGVPGAHNLSIHQWRLANPRGGWHGGRDLRPHEQADGRQGVDNRLSQLRQFAATQNWEVVGEYADHESGDKADGAEFCRMFRDAAQRRIDVALVWALDRLTREGVAETFEYIKRLASHGVQFVSFTEEHFRTTGPAGELVIAVAAWIAKQERVRISERVQAGVDRARAQGTKSGRLIGRPRVVFRRDQAIELRRGGLSWREIGRKLGAGTTTVRQACAGAMLTPVSGSGNHD